MKEVFFVLGNYDSYCDYLCYDCFSKENVYYLNKRNAMKGLRLKTFELCQKITNDTRFEGKFNKPPYKYRFDMTKVSKYGVNHILIFDSNLCSFDYDYLSWLRKKIKNLSLSLLFINSSVEYPNFKDNDFNNLHNVYDNVFTWDKIDAEKYNFNHIEGTYSKQNIDVTTNNDVYFAAGKVKDRKEKIFYTSFNSEKRSSRICICSKV